jgi:hypothetical protein
MSFEVASGRITEGIEPKELVGKTIDFIHKQLPQWRDDPDRKENQSEDRMNVQLCKFLEVHARNNFPMVCFHHEEYQSGRRRVDLSATPTETIFINANLYTIYDPFLVIECKRLPAPSSDREKEYVTGYEHKNGGIQRFKLGLHGADLPTAVMIGYIQAQSPQNWHVIINSWISTLASDSTMDICAWKPNETLGPLEEDIVNQVAACRSVHSRSEYTTISDINIRHLWVVMHKSLKG